MKQTLKVIGWVAAAIVALIIWYLFPEIQPVVTWILAGAVGYHFISLIVRETVREELFDLRQQGKANKLQLDDIERKVSAILRDALERRRSGL